MAADHHVKVSRDTWKELNAKKEPGESFDEVLQRLIDEDVIQHQN